MPPLLLDDEAVAIAVGQRGAAGQAVRGVEEAAVRALAKLEQVLPSRLRHRVGTLGAATVPVPVPGTGPAVDPAHLTVFAAAIANRERVRFRYRAGDGTDREDRRVFRGDRITEPLATGARVPRREPPAEDVAAYVTQKMYSLAPCTHPPIDSGSCLLRIHEDTLDWLAFRLIALGCEFAMREPPELAAHLREIAAGASRAAGGS